MLPHIRGYLAKSSFFKIVFIIGAANLLTSTILNNIDYQDEWSLNNIEIQYFLFIAGYVLLFLFEQKNENLVLYAIIGRVIFILITNLKYSFFLGRSLDQHIQYLLNLHIINEGKIGYEGYSIVTGPYYVDSPLFHVSISTFSIVTGLDIMNAFKHFPLCLSLLYPLLFFSIINKMNLKNQNYIKFSMFLSSLPIGGGSVIINGIMYAFPFLLGIINQYISLIKSPERINYAVLILLILGSTMCHPIETLNFLGLLFATTILINIVYKFQKSYLINQLLVGILLNVGWIFLRESQFNYFGFIFTSEGAARSVTPTLYLLYNASKIDTIKILISYYGNDLLFSVFIFISCLYLFNEYRKKNPIGYEYIFIIAFLFVIFGLSIATFITKVGFGYYERILRNYYFIIVIFSGYFLNHLDEKKSRIILPTVFIVIVLITSVLHFNYPFLIPSASVIFPVEEDVPLVSQGSVNSIYQRESIAYVYHHFEGRIASDAVTRNQMISFTDPQYYDAYVTWFYPPIKKINPDAWVKEYDIFMIHFPGPSASFEERADIRDQETIREQIYELDLDLVYSNSQSFVLSK